MYKPFCWFEIWLFLSASGDVYVTKKNYFIIINTISILRAHTTLCWRHNSLFYFCYLQNHRTLYFIHQTLMWKNKCSTNKEHQKKINSSHLKFCDWKRVKWILSCGVGYEINKISSRQILKEKKIKKICRVLNKIKI